MKIFKKPFVLSILLSGFFVLFFSFGTHTAVVQGAGRGGGVSSLPTPACNQDTWSCDDWGVCEEDGRERRSCTLTADCAEKESVRPPQEQVCEGLMCSHLESVEDRIRCRIGLSDENMRKEQKILYSPEYCRVEEGEKEKAECINLYWAFEKCWVMPAGEKRQKCGLKESDMTNFAEEKEKCMEEEGDERIACGEELKEAVENYMLFEMYELEFLAESLMEAGRVDLEDVVALNVFVEEQKARIENDESVAAWKRILKDTKARWDLFVNNKVR
jgi:hypothetical protein